MCIKDEFIAAVKKRIYDSKGSRKMDMNKSISVADVTELGGACPFIKN
jgi:hypothetical protein